VVKVGIVRNKFGRKWDEITGEWKKLHSEKLHELKAASDIINPLTPELNPFVQRCLTRFFTGDFASLTVHFFTICVKNQQIHKLFIQFINYVW
jgi:hypothetical protein